MRWDFRNETWNTHDFEYKPHPVPFIGARGPTQIRHRLPTFMQLFSLFWPWTILRTIVDETNCYAGQDDGRGEIVGGNMWEPLTVAGLKAFMGIYYSYIYRVEKATELEIILDAELHIPL
jgi:hypothetical protein